MTMQKAEPVVTGLKTQQAPAVEAGRAATAPANKKPAKEAKKRVRPQGEGGYDECWYPIALASEVAAGQIVRESFLDGRVVVYRGEDGVAQVLSPYCRHLGADLACGSVMGNEVRCAFHHWKYDRSGMCSDIPGGDPIPKTAKLFRFPTAERWGIIWAWNGVEPAFGVPHFTDPDDDLVFIASRSISQNQDPWMLLTNSVDFQHLRFVHGLEFETRPKEIRFSPRGLEYPMVFVDPKIGRMEQFIRVFGTNVISLSGQAMGLPIYSMFAGKAVAGGRTDSFCISATRKDAGPAEVLQQALEMNAKFFDGLIEDDTPIQNTLRFREDHLTAGDEVLGRFFDYLRAYPRSHPAQDYIT